jgi:hypothetical protein
MLDGLLTQSLAKSLAKSLAGGGSEVPNILLNIASIEDYVGAESAVTYSSGTTVETITNINGQSDFTVVSGGTGLTKNESDGFFISTAETQRMITEFQWGVGRTFATVIEIPASPTSDVNIIQAGSGTTPLTNTRLMIEDTTGDLRWYSENGGGGFVLIQSDALANIGGQKIAVVMRLNSASSIEIFINDGSTPVIDLDPNDAVVAGTRNRIIFGGGDAKYYEISTFTEALSDADVLAVMNNMKARRGVTQSNAPFSITDFPVDMQPFGGGIAFGNNGADIPVSGKAFTGSTIEVRVVDSATYEGVTAWQDATTTNDTYATTITGVQRNTGNPYRIEARIKGSTLSGKYTNRFFVGHVMQIWGQSEDEYLIRDIYDETEKPSVYENNRVQIVIDSDDAVRRVEPYMVYEGNANLTSGMIALANTFMRAIPNEYFCFIFNAKGGTSFPQLVDDTGTNYPDFGGLASNRDWPRDENFVEYITDAGGHVDIAGMSWYSANRAFAEFYEDALFPILFGKLSNGTAIGSKPYTHTWKTGETITLSHDFTELYDYTKTKIFMFDSHVFLPLTDLQDAVTEDDGTSYAGWVQLESARLSGRDIVDNVNATAILPLGIPMMHYKNGYKSGSTWVNLNHPAGDTEDGIQLRAELMAISFMQSCGLLSFNAPQFDNCAWASTHVDVWSSSGGITTLRQSRGLSAPTGQDHYTDVVGFEIDGVPAQRAEIQSNGRVRIYPISGTFDNSTSLTFGRGGGSGFLLPQEDSESNLHLDYPIVNNTGLSFNEGVSVRPDPLGENFTNTL